MKNISIIVGGIISDIEVALESKGKHIIKTKTIRERTLGCVEIKGVNDDSDYLADVGLGQVIQSQLYTKGYRSVRNGFFVNLDRCEDIEYLQKLLENADTTANDKIMIRNRIKSLRDKKLSGQIEFDIIGNVVNGLNIPMNESEFMERLEGDSL